jgi:hypothetical protein
MKNTGEGVGNTCDVPVHVYASQTVYVVRCFVALHAGAVIIIHTTSMATRPLERLSSEAPCHDGMHGIH